MKDQEPQFSQWLRMQRDDEHDKAVRANGFWLGMWCCLGICAFIAITFVLFFHCK